MVTLHSIAAGGAEALRLPRAEQKDSSLLSLVVVSLPEIIHNTADVDWSLPQLRPQACPHFYPHACFRQVVDCAHSGSDATSARHAGSHRGAPSLCCGSTGFYRGLYGKFLHHMRLRHYVYYPS